jgi:glycosyltransferase involved in cell wall biosynthesis
VRVVFLNPGHDTAGAGMALKAAFDVETDWTARAICRNTTYLDYPTDIVWRVSDSRRVRQNVLELIRDADVVHSMNSPRPLSWFPLRPEQVPVVHHLGSTFRRDPEAASAICRSLGAIEVTDSIDLLFDGIGWLPVPADIEALAKLRANLYQPSSVIRIAHAPTDREFKDTEAVIRAVESLKRKYPISFDLIERTPNRECLRRKARADIFIDQLKFGFGVNAIECWAMGIPVVSGLTDQTAKKRGLRMWGELPWADATADTLEAVIEHLILDTEWRSRLAQRSLEHAAEWHSQRAVTDAALAFYGVTDDLRSFPVLDRAR